MAGGRETVAAERGGRSKVSAMREELAGASQGRGGRENNMQQEQKSSWWSQALLQLYLR